MKIKTFSVSVSGGIFQLVPRFKLQTHLPHVTPVSSPRYTRIFPTLQNLLSGQAQTDSVFFYFIGVWKCSSRHRMKFRFLDWTDSQAR